MKFNWTKGLFRVWILFTVLWVALVVAVFRPDQALSTYRPDQRPVSGLDSLHRPLGSPGRFAASSATHESVFQISIVEAQDGPRRRPTAIY